MPPKTRDGKVQGAHSCAAKDERRQSIGGPQLCRPKTRDGKVQGPTVSSSASQAKDPRSDLAPGQRTPANSQHFNTCSAPGYIVCRRYTISPTTRPPPTPCPSTTLGLTGKIPPRNMIGEQLGYRPVTTREIGPTANRQALRRRYDYHR